MKEENTAAGKSSVSRRQFRQFSVTSHRSPGVGLSLRTLQPVSQHAHSVCGEVLPLLRAAVFGRANLLFPWCGLDLAANGDTQSEAVGRSASRSSSGRSRESSSWTAASCPGRKPSGSLVTEDTFQPWWSL